jgi:hypothetical protein
MKKIINGKKYDTESAEEIGINQSGDGRNDFRYFCEVLYKKKTGEFFLHGEGGGLSPYAESCGSGRTWGEAIIPLSVDDTMEWVEKNLSADVYEGLFGEVAE